MFAVLAANPAIAASPADIDRAIDKAKHRLYDLQRPDGSWGNPPAALGADGKPVDPSVDARVAAQYSGCTALDVYALISAGESPNDPRIARAIELLLQAKSAGIYAVGVRCLVWNSIPRTAKVAAAFMRDKDLLLKSVKARGQARAMYYYFYAPTDDYDHSVSQYGILGAWACFDGGLTMPADYWKETDRAWRNHQYADGSWAYQFAPPGDNSPRTITDGAAAGQPTFYGGTANMTAAGVATLFLTSEIAHRAEVADARGNITDKNIDLGMDWLAKHFDNFFDPKVTFGGIGRENYGLFGVERVGVASGYKLFGTVDWYQRGADYLLKTQRDNGEWDGYSGVEANSAFGILFLARGRAPVAISKLQYNTIINNKSSVGNWNQRPRDIANLVRWTGRQIEANLNWEIVNLDAPVENLFDSRILYIAGNQPVVFYVDNLHKLKQFIDGGGLIIANADARSRPFAVFFQKAIESLYPTYEFRELPDDHPIYVNGQFRKTNWRTKPHILGMSNGVRELTLIFPDSDPAIQWQLQPVPHESFELGSNIFQYVTDKQSLLTNDRTYLLKIDPAITADRKIKIARLQYDGNWDPEPGGWQHLSAIAHNEEKTDIELVTIQLGKNQLTGGDVKIAHLTGTDTISLNTLQQQELKQFVEAGGKLIIDAAGGSTRFTASAQTMLASLFGQDIEHTEPLPITSPVFALPKPLTEVTYRRSAQKSLGQLTQPRIKAIQIACRPAVFFSAEDLSAGLTGQPFDGIVGYSPESAIEIVVRLVIGK